MNRTVAFVSAAATLGVLALILGLPLGKSSTSSASSTATLAPTPAPQPPVPQASVDGALRLDARLSHPFIAVGTHDVFVTADVSAVTVPGAQRAPVNLALVLDRSGSMSGEKIVRAKQAALQLISELSEADRLAIVPYSTTVAAFPSAPATLENRDRMRAYVQQMYASGGTNIGDALRSAKYEVLRHAGEYRVNRLVLISDGQPTVGVVQPRSLIQLAQEIRAEGVTVSALGVGLDFNEDLMQQLAERGAGSYGYIRDATAMASLFQKDLRQAATTVARGVTLSFTVPPGVQVADVLGYRFNQVGRDVQIDLPDFASGQVEKVVLRVSVSGSAPEQTVDVAGVRLSYTDVRRPTPEAGAAQVHLSARVTERRDEMLAKRDKAAVVTATRALTSVNYRRAAEELAKGADEKAAQYVRANEVYFADDLVQTEMKAERAENQAVLGGVMAAPSRPAEARSDQVKSLKSKALKKAGRGDSVY